MQQIASPSVPSSAQGLDYHETQLLLCAAEQQAAQREEEETAAKRAIESRDNAQEQQKFLYRLFVGWIPKHYEEKDLTPLFSQYGVVRDIIVLRERLTGQKRGCAFVSFATEAEAENAIQNLDRQIQLPGALSLLEVRFAKSHQYVRAGSGPEDNRQLFFTSAPPQLSEPEISNFFSQFGVVEELNLFRERRTGNSKGCGFITLQTREQAVKAMEALENKSAEPSKEMSVQWADPELQMKKKKALEDSNAENRMLFFAKVLRSAHEEDVKRLFSQFGKVYDVNLFRAFQGAPTTKGCGLVTMGTHEEARAAIEGLDGKFCWDGLDSPMVVKWMDAALQRRRREQHLAAMLQGLSPNVAGTSTDAWLSQPTTSLGGVSGLVRGGGRVPQALLLYEPEATESPPAGCMPDAIKLFVGNIPKVCTEEQLLPFFETIGKVAELVIVRDKVTHQSKGSAFVWYVSRAHAERAILQFNLRHVLPDPTGEQDRPLVVRKARVRAAKTGLPASMMTGLPAGTLQGSLAAGLSAVNSAQPGLRSGTTQLTHSAVAMVTNGSAVQPVMNIQGGGGTYYTTAGAPGTLSGPSQVIQAPSGTLETLALQQGGTSYVPVTTQSGFRTVQRIPGAQLVSIQAAPSVSETGLYDAYGPGVGVQGEPMERFMLATTSGPSPVDNIAPLALSVPLSMQQLGLVNNHLFNVQSMCGAQLNVSPGAPGLFHLLISGTKGQVESAKSLVSQILGQQII